MKPVTFASGGEAKHENETWGCPRTPDFLPGGQGLLGSFVERQWQEKRISLDATSFQRDGAISKGAVNACAQ